MHEQGNFQPGPREQLIDLLSRDYTTPEREEYERRGTEEGNALSSFLARALSLEDVEQRLDSEECMEIMESASAALDKAPITISFKGFIIGHLVKAYTHETRADDSVSLNNLGFLDSAGLPEQGIYDPDKAKAIEGAALRRFLFDITSRQVLVSEDEVQRPIIPNPALYARSMDAFDEWTVDYISKYGEDPFTGMDAGEHLDAAARVRIISEEEASESGWGEIIVRLRQLRGED